MDIFQACPSVAYHQAVHADCGAGPEGQKGTSTRVLVPQSSVIEDYNFGMRGTDGIDQKISNYRNEMRCQKWQSRLFMHLFMQP
jgi:hypothetical protein